MLTIISLLTDFGTRDTSVGQCKGVIYGISPKAIVVDLTHEVPHYDVTTGAWLLRFAVPRFPPSIHVAVVDPGVGTPRRPVAIECAEGHILIGPDNGLLMPAADALGGISMVVELRDPRVRQQPVSTTFHARDIFCPAAAHIVHGVSLHLLGPYIEPETLLRLPVDEPRIADGVLTTAIGLINEYGSLALTAPAALLQQLGSPGHVRARIGNMALEVRVARTFGEVPAGEPVLLTDSYGQLCLAINQGDLAGQLGLAKTDRLPVSLEAVNEQTQAVEGEVRQ